jgi:hypothetical protein
VVAGNEGAPAPLAGPGARVVGAGTVVGTELDVEEVKTLFAVPSRNDDNEGNWTGFTNTMMQVSTIRVAAAIPSSLRLRSMAARSAARKKPLRTKKSSMLMELFTRPAYQNGLPSDTWMDGTSPRW